MSGRLGELDEHAVAAVQQFIRQRTVPLILDLHDGTYEMLGTGTLAELSGRKFIITARHCVVNRPLKDLALPEAPTSKSVLKTLGGVTMSMSKTEEVDVAVIDVTSTWLKDQPNDGWQFIREESIGNFTVNDAFLVVGYPVSMMKQVANDIYGPPVMIITGMIAGTPAGVGDAIPGLDRFFHYAPESELLDGGTVESVRLPGVSGTAVWQYTPAPDTTIWSPNKCLQVLAVEHAYKLSQYVRAHDWRMIGRLVEHALTPPPAPPVAPIPQDASRRLPPEEGT